MTSKYAVAALITYFNSLPSEKDRSDWIAGIGGSSSYIRQVMLGHKRPSAKLTLKIAHATNWSVTPHQILPSIFINSYDGIPKKVFCNANSNLSRHKKSQKQFNSGISTFTTPSSI